MKAMLKNYRQSPRKVALIADLIRGKSVEAAKQHLSFLPKKGAPALEKLLDSAIANARSSGTTPENLFVKTITVNKGRMQKRYRPFSRGRAGAIRKTMSHVAIELAPIEKAENRKQRTMKNMSKAQ